MNPASAQERGGGLTAGQRLLATSAVMIAAFMNVLDSTIAVVALPSISGSLSATPSQGSWVLTVYGVCLAAVLPLAGWVGKRFGQIRAFGSAVFLFTLTSWLCGIAGSFNELLIFRALQGASGGLLLPFSQSIMLRIYPPEEHGRALGLWGLAAAVAPVAGPVLGGIITDYINWRWIFYINLPFGIYALLITLKILTPHETERVRNPVDGVGLLLLITGIVSLQLVLDRGHELDWFAHQQIRWLTGIGVSALVLFLVWELDEEHPIVDLSLFRLRGFALGALMTAMFYSAMTISSVLYPLWMQTTLGYTPLAAGLVMATTSIFPILSMPIMGQWMRHQNPRILISIGSVMLCITLLAHGAMTTQVSNTYLASVRFMVGLAMPLLWMPAMMVTLIGIPPSQTDSATGLSNFLRMLSASLATAVGVTLWEDRSIVHRANLVDAVAADSPERIQAMGLMEGMLGDAGTTQAALETMISQQARTLAQQDVYLICAGVTLSVLLLVLLLPNRLPASGATQVVID